MYDVTRFHYTPSCSPKGLVVVVPNSLSSKQELFDRLASTISFPNYFGENWDALIDCLSDLSWIDATEVTLLHEGLPRLPERELRTYLECLQDVLERTAREDLPVLTMMFPQSVTSEIVRLLAAPA